MLVDGLGETAKLPAMPPRRSRGLLLPLSPLLLLAASCERRAPPPTDSVVERPVSAGDSLSPARGGTGWDPVIGPVLLVQGATPGEAIVLLPDDSTSAAAAESAKLASAPAVFFGRGGARATGRLVGPEAISDEGCPLWSVDGVAGSPSLSAWSVGFVATRVSGLPMDSVEALSARDSMALVAETARLASTVPGGTAGSFQGLRFTVTDIHRFTAAPGVQALVAHLVRKVNQEANPQEEQTLLVAERDSGAAGGAYHVVYAERVHGLEESVATPDVIGGIRVGADARPALVIARDGNDGVSYSLLERVSGARWRVRWTSRPTQCA